MPAYLGIIAVGALGVGAFKVVSDEVSDLGKLALVGGAMYIGAKVFKVI